MKRKDTRLTGIMVAVFISVTVVWFLSFLIVSRLFGAPDGAGRAGDLFGAVGALFSGWAFVGVLWAISLQRKSLEIQHEDLKGTRGEMQHAREAHEESAHVLYDQVEATRLQTRVQVLTNLLDIPMKVDSSTFLSGFSRNVVPHRDRFKENFAELAESGDKLREKDEDISNK